jgi:ParB family chromosome partitioning protein
MVAELKRKNLGKGLSALLGEASEDYAKLDRVRSPKAVPIELLRPSPYQPRHLMAEQDLEDLARSVAEKGILQPILVRRHATEPDAFEIIAGERRWRAAQMAQLHEVPVVVKDLSDREALEIALIENLQRQDLSPLEEAEGYRRLMEEFTHTQENLARSVSKSRSHVANMMRLLGLPEPVKKMLDNAELSAGHARALLGAEDAGALARQVVKRGLNVRQTERLVKAARTDGKRRPRTAEKDTDTLALERDLSNLLGLAVEVKLRAKGGSLILHYRSLDQLDDILHRLSHGSRGGLSDVAGKFLASRDNPISEEGQPGNSEAKKAIGPGYFPGDEPSG